MVGYHTKVDQGGLRGVMGVISGLLIKSKGDRLAQGDDDGDMVSMPVRVCPCPDVGPYLTVSPRWPGCSRYSHSGERDASPAAA